MMQNPLRQWLSFRIRILCVLVFLAGGFFPVYVPGYALAVQEDDLSEQTPQFLLVEDGFLMKSSSLTQQGARRAYAEGIIHIVRDGESFEKVAQRYGVKTETILWANNLAPNATLRPNQELVILPVDGVLHTVARGQTLQQIAELYSIAAPEISAQNKIEGNFILAGQELIIPGGKPIVSRPGTQIAGGSQLTFNPSVPGGFYGRQPVPAPTKPSTGGTPAVNIAVEPSYGTLQMPCNDCYYTQYFRPGHYAVDIQTKGGGPIFAAEGGKVIRADTGWNGGYGNVIEVAHGDGLVTLYAHNKTLYVKEGDEVGRGQYIADMGNTGRVYGKTGIHTHFEVQVNGVKKNSILYLK